MNKPKILIFILSLSIVAIAATGFMITQLNAGPCTGVYQATFVWPMTSPLDRCFCTYGVGAGAICGVSAVCCGGTQGNCASDILACPR